MSEISPSSKGIGTLATLLQNPQEADNVTPPLDFDTWDAQIGSGIPDREQKWRSYANYHRMHWFDQGTLTEAVEGNINASLKRHLLEEGFIDEETPNSEIFKPNPVSLDKQTNLVTRAFGENVASVWKQGKENGESEEVLNKTLNDAKSFLVDVGELPFASLSNLDGSRQIIGGTSVMNPVSAFENAVRDGAVSYEDAILVQSGLQQGSDIGANRFKDQRRSRLLNEVQNLISDEVGNDQARENFDALSDLLIREDQGRSAKEELHGGMYVKKDRNFFNKLLREQLAEQYSKDKDVNLNLASKRFSDEEIRSVIEEQAALRANLSGEFEYFSEDADLTRNIRVYGTTAVAHPQLMLQPTRFEEALEKDTRLTDKQKDSLRNQRDFYKRQRYESVNNILKETKATSERWIAASAQGAQAGEDPVETLDKFLSNKDNYDAFKNQSTSILASIGDSFASLYNIPAALLFKSEDAARRLGEAAQEESRRREVAKLFNQEYGLGMDVMTMVAPVLVDIGATAALSMTTMGAGGAAYIGLKTGTTLTAKGFAKGMLGGVLRTASKKDFLEKTVDAGLGYSRVLDPREVAVRELAEKNLKEKLIRSTSEKNAIEAINVYNQMLDNKLLMSSKTFGSLFVTSANRSAGGMFTTIYNSMPEDMSHDEKYDAAIGSALLAGTVTGLITTAFMKLGRGGLEEAFLDGMTFRQMKGVMDRQLGVKLGDDVSNEVAEKFLKKKMRRALGNSPIIEGTLSEAIEEGIDELAQTFIRDAALNEDTPLKEIAAGVGHSMLLGGIFGGGATGARALYNKLGGPTGDEARYRAQVADEIIEKLKEAGAPATADELEIQETRRLLTAPQREVGERRRRRPEETPEAPEPAPAPQAEQEDEVVETTEDEVEEEGASPEDQTEFDFTTGLSPEQFQFRFDTSVEGTDPNRRVEEEQLEIDLDLTSRPVTTTNLLGETEILQEGDPVQTEFSTEDFVNLLDENISPETVSEALTEQLEDRADTLDKPSSGVANEAAKQKVKTKKIYPEERKLQQLISRLNESTSIIKGQEYVFPTADIPIAKEEFIDDHLTATEVKAFEDLIRKGVPVDLTQDRAVHGMPDRSMFPKGYYENKSQLLNELIELRYPKRSSFLPQDVKNPVKDKGKVIGYLDSDGNALFENDPVKAAKLLLMGYSIKAPISKADLNPAFIYKEGSDLIEGVLIDGGFSGNKRVNKNSINEVFPSVADNLSSNTEVLNLFSNNERGVVVGTRPLGEGTELRSNFRKKGTAQSKEQPIREVRQQITDFFKAVRENPEGKVEALNLLKSPKAQDVLESDFSDQAIIALEQEFNMVTVLHELNTTLRETEGAVEINEDTGVATPTKRGIDVFKSRLASSDPDAIEKAASVLKINLATSETKSDKVILEFLSDYVLNDPLLQKDSISFREVGLRVFNRFNSFQTNYKDAEGKFYPKDTQTRRYVRLVDPSVAATFDPSAVNFMNDLVLDAASVLEEDQSLRDSVNAYLDLTTALDDIDGRPDWRTGVMSGNEVLGLLIDQGATLRSLDPSSEHGKAFLALYKKSLRGKDSRPLHTLLRLISGTTDSVSKEGDITKDLALLEDVRARVEATLGQSFSTPKTIAVINAIRKSSAEAHTTTHYAFGEQATPDVPTATESVSDITSRTIDDIRKLQKIAKGVGSVDEGVEEVWSPRATGEPDVLRTEISPTNKRRLDNQEAGQDETDTSKVESDDTLTVDESNILTRLINRMGTFVRRNGLSLNITNTTGGLAAARARTGDVFLNQNSVANLIKKGKSESVIRRILNSIMGEEVAHVASYRSISKKQLNKLINETSDAEFETIVDEYTPDNPARNEQLKAALQSEEETTVQQTKEILIEEKLRMYAQDRMTGTTSEANYEFWTGDPTKLQIVLEYLRRMVSRLLKLKKKGLTTPEMDMAISNLVEEINVLMGRDRFTAGNLVFDPNSPDDYITGLQKTTLGEVFPEDTPELEDPDILQSELAVDTKQFRKLILTGDSGNSNLEDLLNSKEVEKVLDVSILNEEDNTRAKVQILDAWVADNKKSVADLNALVKKAAEANGYDTSTVYYHGSTKYNIDTPQTRFGTVSAFVSETPKDAQSISAIAQQESLSDIILHRWYIKKDLKLFDHEDPSQVDEFISKLKQEDEFKNLSEGDPMKVFANRFVKRTVSGADYESMLREKLKQGQYSFFSNYEVTNLAYDDDPRKINLSVRNALKRLGYDGHYEREDTSGKYGRSLAIFEPYNIKSAETVTFKQSLNAVEDREDGGLRYETQVVPLDLRFDPRRTEVLFTSLGITGKPIEAGPETDRILDTSAKDAAIRAQGKFDEMGVARSFLDEIPEFESNYNNLKAILSETREQIGEVSREEMPIVQPQQVEEFGRFLSEKLERPVSVGQKRVRVATMKPYQTELFFPKTVWFAMQKHFNMQDSISGLSDKPFSVMSSDGFILDGNHRYGQMMLINPEAMATANVVDLPIAELIPLAQEFSDMMGNNRKIDRGGQELRISDLGPFDIEALNNNEDLIKGRVVKTGIYMLKSEKLSELVQQEQQNFKFGKSNFIPLKEEDIHITLISKEFADEVAETDILGEAFRLTGQSPVAVLPNLTFHAPEISTQIQPDGTLRQSLVRRVVEQEVLNNFVEKNIIGGPSPDENRIYHVTLGNLTGNPRDSVAYPNPTNSVVVNSKEHLKMQREGTYRDKIKAVRGQAYMDAADPSKGRDLSLTQLLETEARQKGHVVEGAPVIVFHGSTNKDLKTFDSNFIMRSVGGHGFYFTGNYNVAANYAQGDVGRVYQTFLKADKVFRTRVSHTEGSYRLVEDYSSGTDAAIQDKQEFFKEFAEGLSREYNLSEIEIDQFLYETGYATEKQPIVYLVDGLKFDQKVRELVKTYPENSNFRKIEEDLIKSAEDFDTTRSETFARQGADVIRISPDQTNRRAAATKLVSKISGYDAIHYEASDVWVVFSPEQIKSAEVTRDDFGDIIPLSNRFDTGPRLLHSGLGATENIWTYPEGQQISSADTSINRNKLPATFGSLTDKGIIEWEEGTKNADIGGGSFDNGTEKLATLGVANFIYDPFNRGEVHNKRVVEEIRDGQSDTATVNNVLNVIQEEDSRGLVIRQAANAIKPEGKAYFLIHEGNRDGVGKTTTKGWQNHKKAADYVPEIKEFFGKVIKKSNLLIATEPVKEDLLKSELGATNDRYMELAQDPEGNKEVLQQFVKRAAESTGYTVGPLFHGTPADFDAFSYSKIGFGTGFQYGTGFYFTKSRTVAEGYTRIGKSKGRILSAYLKVNNPRPHDSAPLSAEELRPVLERVNELEFQDMLKENPEASINDTFVANFGSIEAAVEMISDPVQNETIAEQLGEMNGSGIYAKYYHQALKEVTGIDALTADFVTNSGEDATITVVLTPEQIKLSDPVTYDEDGNIIPLTDRFDPTMDSFLYSELGATDKKISGYTYSTEEVTVDRLEKMLEAPVYEDGVYDSEKRKNSWWRKFKVAMTGALDIRVRRMFEQREAFNRAVQNDVNLRATKLRKILDKDFIDKGFSIPYELISEATGSSKVVSIPDDVRDAINLQHKSRKADINEKAKRKEITEEEKKTLLEDATNKYKNDIRKQQDVQREIIRKKKDAALTQLEKVSPEFVNELKALRDTVDSLSIKLKELYNVDVDLSATIDSNLGIYITRSYKMFNDAGWLDKVTKDPKFSTVRDNAAKYFADTYKQARIKAFIKDGKEESEATALAEKELTENKDLGRSMMLSFLHSYKDKESSNLIAGPEAVESFASPLINQLKKKRDIDESIRALLGEETDEGAGFKNLLRTYLSVGMMASNQAFMKNLLEIGRKKGNEWILTKDELKKKRLENIDEYGGSRYKQIRAGGAEAYDPFRNFEVEVDGEPKNVQLFAPAEMVDGLMSVLNPPSQESANDAEKIASGSFKLMARITGLSLGAKTLGNIGFYVRNVISNAFYFGPANGFVRFGKMTDSLITELDRRGIRQETANDYYTELIALDVIGNEIRPKLIEELLSGQTSPETVLNDFEKNLSRLENEEGKSISRKGKELAQKANEKTWGKAKELSAIVDAFYKIALFEHELKYLIDAREASRKDGKQDFYATKTDYELKRLAAEKVVMTSQTYSQAPPIITGLQGHTFGVMFAPFLRFKGEVIRTYFNTWNLAMKESKDSNPVIRKRGRRRLAGIGFVTGVSSVILPITTRLLQGIFYDDDEALRDTLPPYMQNQSLVYYTNPLTKERRNFSLTFINPYSMLTDPSLRAMEHLVHGNTSKTVESLVKGTLGEFLDQQIFMRAFLNSTTNFDPKKQEPIYEENDPLHDKFTKSIKYVLNEAYTPPTLTKLLEDRAIFKDGFDITKAPEIISNIIGQFKPATTYPIEFDVRLSEFVEKRKGEFDRINSNKYKMLTDRVMTKADITSLAKKEIEGRRRVNAHLIQLYRSFERQGLPREEIYNISLRRGMSKRRVQLLLAKGLMDRPSLPMPFIESMARKGETHIQRLRDFQAELNKYPRFLSVEP
jgi:hypothetical protein